MKRGRDRSMAGSYARGARRTIGGWAIRAIAVAAVGLPVAAPAGTLDDLRRALFPGAPDGAPAAIRTTARVESGGRVIGTVTTVARRDPPAIREILELGPVRQVATLLGNEAWFEDANGKVRAATGDELATYRLSHALLFHAYLDGDPAPFRREVAAEEIRFVPAGAGAARTLDLARDADGRLLPVRLHQRQQGTPVVTTFEDWRVVDGIRFPFRSVQDSGDPRFDLILTATDVAFPPALRPGEIPVPGPGHAPDDVRILDPARAESIPLRRLGALVAVPVELPDGTEAPFLLDTGAGATVLDRAVAERLGLEVHGTLEARGAGGSEAGGYVRLASLGLPGVAIRDQMVATLGLDALGEVLGVRIDGILGYDFLSRFTIRIDYPRARLGLFPPGTAPPPGARRAPLRVEANVPRLDGVLDGEHHGSFVLDLGNASALVLHPGFARRAGYLGRATGTRTPITGIGGARDVRSVRIESLVLGGIEFRDISAVVPMDDGGALALDESIGNAGAGLFTDAVVWLDYDAESFWVLDSTADSASAR
jgi:predicted aspartyl protease